MRILVFANDQDLKAREAIEALRAEGHHASFRNPQYFDGRPEKCDQALFDLSLNGCAQVMQAFEKAGIKAVATGKNFIVAQPPTPVTAEAVEVEEVAKPARKQKK